MAGCFDSPWRVGSKARGTRSPFKLATEGLLPFKCTFPVQLTSVMDRVPSPQSDLRRGETPVRETRTRTIREYEETIEELRKENFDLKLRRFLLEESLQKYLQKNNDSNSVQIVVELSQESHSLKEELANKEQLLQEALEQVGKYASDLNELQSKFVELQEQLKFASEIRLEKAWVELKDDKEHFEKEAGHLKEVLKEKDQIIQNANVQIEELSKQYEVLEQKTKKKSAAIQGIVHKYHKEGEMIPRDLRPIVQKAVQAAKECDQDVLNETLGELKASLCKIMPAHVQEFSSAQLHKENEDPSRTKTSVTELKKSSGVSQSVREGDQSFMPTDSKLKFVHVHGEQSPTRVKTLSQSSESVRSLDSEETENIERMVQALTDNDNLKADNEEKTRTINDLNSTCSELERRSIQLQSELTKAVSKIKKLEMEISQERSRDKSASSELSDSFLQIVGQSNSVDVLKEEIFRLLLIIQQKDKELEEIEIQENDTFSNTNKDMEENLERNYLQGRLALSCQVNHDLMDHLRKLETFMEDLLLNKNLDSSSIENISEASDVFSRLTTCLDETKKLSSALSEHLSVCENSKLFESSDISLRPSYSQSGKQSYSEDQSRLTETSNAHYTSQGRNTFFQSESPKPTAGTGKRRLSFSTLHNAKSVVLGTSNNEDLILLLNDRGDPEDVLIRNNDNPSTHPYLDSSMGFWKSPETGPKVRCCPSSDSDIWSEPDRDVSMQRIGIEVQRSPVAQKSPRRLRLRDKRATDELSSPKNESSSSAVKGHPLSKRRRSIETLKSPFVCKKCLSQSPSKDESAEKEKFQKVVSDLSNRCSNQENQLEEMREVLNNKIKENDKLAEEKLKLSNSIDKLEKELKELKIKKEELSLQSSESSGKLTEVSDENIKLRKSIERLESKATESDSVCKKLKEELEETKVRLQNLDKKCSEYELDLASSSITVKDCNEKYSHLLNEKNKLLNTIQELVLKKDELLESIQLEKKKILQFEMENSELKGKLQEKSQSFISLQSKYSELENKSKEQLKKSQESVVQEKNELLSKIQELDSTKTDLLQSITSKENKIQQFEHENSELKEKLQEKSQSFLSLQSKYSELESKSKEQLKKSQESVVQEKNEFLSKIQKMDSTKNELLQSIGSKENKIQQLEHETGKMKESIRESLLKVKNLFWDNLRNLSDVCKQYLNCEDERCKDIDNYLYGRLTTFEKDDKIKELFTDINTVSSKFKQIIGFLSDQLRSVSFNQHKFEMNKKEIETLQNLNSQLNVRNKSLQLAENESKSLTEESKSQIEFLQQDLMKAREEIKAKESYISELQAHVNTIQQSFKGTEESSEQSKHMLSALEMKIKTLQEKIKEYQKLLALKDEQISVWQNSALKAGFQLKDSSMERMAVASQIRMNSSNLATGTVSALDPSKGSPNVSKAPETSITREVSDVRGSCDSIATSFSSIASAKDEEAIKNADKYMKKIKSLKLKLVMSEKRIEILEQEKNDLRKELLAQVKRSQSSEEIDNLRKDLADMRERLEAKTSFIKDMKNDMFTTYNSLVDKQKEVDDLRNKLSDSKAQCTELKLKGKDGSLKFRFSDQLHSDPEANIKTLKRQKWELIQNILDQQKQFYERKNIHLGHLEKFKTHIERLQAVQVSPTMFKSDSEPFLNSSSTENNCFTEKCDKTSTNLQGQLELDIECLQNFSVFLKRFFIPLVLQSCENCTKTMDSSPKHSSKDIEKSASSPAKMLHDNMSDRESLSEENINLSRSGSVSPMSYEGNLPFQSTKNRSERSQVPASQKNGKDNYSELSHKSSNVVGGSQESIFNRSHFSSPDLGIESDPNHESSAPEKDEPSESRLSRRHESGTKVKGWSPEKQVPESAHGIPTKLQDHEPFSGGDTLHAICMLQHYEHLKKEVQESLVLIKNVLSRTRDGLQRTTRFASPQKNLEYATFKAIKDTSGDIEVCLEEARKLVEKFWIAPCPSQQEIKMLIQQSQEQQEEIRRIRESKVKQEKYYDEALARVKQAEIAKDKMEKKISKKLVSTKKVIRRAELKLLEQGSHDQSPLPEYPRED